MGPAEAGLVHKYDDIHRKFFPAPEVVKQRRTEAELLAKIHDLQIAYASVANKLSTEQKYSTELDKRLTFMEKLFKPEFLDEKNPPNKIITVHSIIRLVCKIEKVPRADMVSARRTSYLSNARHLVYYLAGTLTHCSLPQIGRLLGDRDHTTIMHGRDKIARLRTSQPDLDAKLKWYEKALTGEPDGNGT